MSRWSEVRETLHGGRVTRYAFADGDDALTHGRAIALLAEAPAFREHLTRLLADNTARAFRWETPALSRSLASRPFECVVIDDPRLERTPDQAVFNAYFSGETRDALAVAVPNLGRTSELIVPRRIAEPRAYTHLAAFLRGAPDAQIHALWQCVATTVLRNLSEQPLWLSTAGAGVAWLHVRVDRVPKYYAHRPYASV